MKDKKKWLALAFIAVILTASVVGTIAYLTDTTGPVENTFTMGQLLDKQDKFVLKEHKATDTDKDGVYTLDTSVEVDANAYTVLPGVDLPKDPFVKTSKALETDAYVFIEVVDKTGTALTATVDTDNWTQLAGVTGPNKGNVYALKANGGIAKAGSALGPVTILKGNKIVVANAAITDAEAQFGGGVDFYGYMIQAAGFTSAADAWAKGFGGNN